MAKGAISSVNTINSVSPLEAFSQKSTPLLNVNTNSSNDDQTAGKIAESGLEMAAPIARGIEALPNAGRAGRTLGEIATQAKDVPVMMRNAEAPLQRLTELGVRGGKMPSSANALLTRSQGVSPMTFPEARDYYSNIAGVARNELGDMSKPIARQYGMMKSGLHSDLTDAAATIGRGEDYANSIKEYARAKNLQEMGGNIARRAGKIGLGLGAGALGLEGVRSLLGK